MQKRWPVGAGPSGKTWPRWASHLLHSTSVRSMNRLRSSRRATAPSLTGAQKLGQPVPESYLASDENSGWPQHTQR